MAIETLFPGVAIVTGAAGTGIGTATAKAFALAGCIKLAITDLNPSLLEATRRAILTTHPNIQILSIAGDVSTESFVKSFIRKTVEKFGRVDYAVNCAGILGSGKKSVEMSVEEFDKANAVNYRGAWLCSRAQIEVMQTQEFLSEGGRRRQRGSLVHIASQLGIVGRPAAPEYSASKAAVMALTRADAIDYSDKGIRVNCICPGIIETPMTIGDEDKKERNDEFCWCCAYE